MSGPIAPQKTVQFTITKVPRRAAERKTIDRLMRMQPAIQGGLRKLAQRRRRQDNVRYIRAGVEWISRARVTRLTRVEEGETFTLTITPQIIPDLNSVQTYLKARAV